MIGASPGLKLNSPGRRTCEMDRPDDQDILQDSHAKTLLKFELLKFRIQLLMVC